ESRRGWLPLAEGGGRGVLRDLHRANPLQMGLSKEEVRSRFFRREPGEVFRHFLEEAAREKKLRVEKDLVALHEHRVSLDGADAGVSAQIEGAYKVAGLNPPELEELAATL